MQESEKAKQEKAGIDRRRSPRIELHIPLRVEGVTASGQTVKQAAEAEQVSAHGARVKASSEFRLGSNLKVENLQNRQSGVFRVVWAYEKPGEGKWMMGLELTKGHPTLWGVDLSAQAAPPS